MLPLALCLGNAIHRGVGGGSKNRSRTINQGFRYVFRRQNAAIWNPYCKISLCEFEIEEAGKKFLGPFFFREMLVVLDFNQRLDFRMAKLL